MSVEKLVSGQTSTEDALNELLPDSSAITKMPVITLLVKAKIQELRDEMQMIRAQVGPSDAVKTAAEIREDLGLLISEAREIESAATESQIVVKDITKNIQALDVAKRNLASTVSTLKRFQMLSDACDELLKNLKDNDFRRAASILDASAELVKNLEPTAGALPRVGHVLGAVRNLQNDWRKVALTQAKRLLSKSSAIPVDAQSITDPALFSNLNFSEDTSNVDFSLSDVCAVIRVLGDEGQLLSWAITALLNEYKKIFGLANEAGQLDNVTRRFSWFRKTYRQVLDDVGRHLPSEWNFNAVFAGSFLCATHYEIKTLLERKDYSLETLLEALSACKDFEAYVTSRMHLSVDELATYNAGTAYLAITPGTTPSSRLVALFDPHLGLFVNEQDKKLADLLANLKSKRVSLSLDVLDPILPSASELFVFYKDVFQQCTTISKGEPLLGISRLFAKWLSQYADVILASKSTTGTVSTGESPRPSLSSPANVSQIRTLCLVVNTTDYCLDTVSQLESLIKATIDPGMKDSVDMTDANKHLHKAASDGLASLVQIVEQATMPTLLNMSENQPKEGTPISKESQSMEPFINAFSSIVPLVRESLQNVKYLRSFYDKMTNAILLQYAHVFVRARPVSLSACEQALIDVQVLRTALLRAVETPDDAVSSVYSKFLGRSIHRLEALFKSLMAPTDDAEFFVNTYLVLVQSDSVSEFSKLLDLKGIPKPLQSSFVDVFLDLSRSMPNLSDKSFLSALDMDVGQKKSFFGQSPKPSAGTRSDANVGGFFTRFGWN